MKLRAITLDNVRRFTDPVRIDGIADGINVLSAPNEHGKSTVFDALHALFFVPHGSSKKEIKHLRPHSGGATEVSVEIDLPDGRHVISKRWFSRAEARVVRDGTLIAQADEAEAWLSRLMGGGDGGPSGLLWVRQGLLGLDGGSASEKTAALETRKDLLSSVTGEVETMTGGKRMDAALARCQEDLLKYATATGRPKAGGPWAQAAAEVEKLSAEQADLADRVSRLQSALDDRTRLRRDLAELEDPQAAAERDIRLNTARAAFTAAQSHADRVAALDQALQTATLQAAQAQAALTMLMDARQRRAAAGQAQTEAQQALGAARAALTEADDTAAKAKADLATAGARHQRADAVLRKVESRSAAEAAARLRSDLQARLAQAEAARQSLEAAQAQAAVGPDDAAMDRLWTCATGLTTARAVRDTTATRITMHYVDDGQGGVRHARGALVNGETLPVLSDMVLELDGIGDLIVHPGAGPETDKELARAEAALAAALAQDGFATVDEAALAHDRRKQATRRLEEARTRLEAVAPRGMDDLRARLAALPEEEPDTSEDLPDRDAAAEAVRQAGIEMEEIAARQEAVADRLQLARDAHTRASVQSEQAAAALTSATAALDGLEARDPSQLQQAADAAHARRANAQAALDEARAQAPDLAAAEAALTRAKSVVEAAQRQIADLRPAIAALDERIRGNTGEAVEERLQETTDRLEAAQARLAGVAREVRILDRLRTALEAARAEARDRYFEPVSAELRPLLHLLWPEAELNWADQTLLPQSLIRDGREEPLDILSGGTQEQIALLVRLAFARLLAKNGRAAPVILDDALVFSDDDRIERMFDALHRQAGDLQIIVLSCRQRAFRDLGGRTLRIVRAQDA